MTGVQTCALPIFIEAKAKELGAEVVAEGLRLEGDGGGNDEEVSNYTASILQHL